SATWPSSSRNRGPSLFFPGPLHDVAAGRVFERLELARAGCAREHLVVTVLRGHPRLPVAPPRAGMLLRALEPFVRGRGTRIVRPVVILLRGGRVDDSRDMTGTAQHEAHVAPQVLAAEVGRLPRGDVVFGSGDEVRRHFDFR